MSSAEKQLAAHIEEHGDSKPDSASTLAADEAQRVETSLSVRDALRYYRKAVAWSVAVSMSTVMESYGMLLINSFFAFPTFKQKYGELLPDGSYSIPARWQLALTIVTNIGLIVGVFMNGYLADRFGLRKVLLGSHVLFATFVFINFFATSVGMLVAGTFLISIPCGLFAAATPSYAAEVAPLRLNGYLTVYVNLCWVMGKLIAFGVLSGMLTNTTEWSYRIPFAIQWAWPPFLIVAIFLAPESPWWLVRNGRIEEAERSLRRLCSAPDDVIDPKNTIAMMSRTIETEREQYTQGSYLDCFRGENLRRTEIAMIGWGCQILPGFAVQNYITYFFTLAGLATSDAFHMSIGNAGLAFVGTVSSWFMMTRFGWRTLYIGGLAFMIPVMSLVGFLDLAANSNPNVRWAQAALLLLWFFTYGISIGPIPYGIAASVGAANLRVKTISLGRNTYYFLSIINVIVSPYMLNPTEGNLKGKAAFPAAGLTVMLIVWAYFRLPELKGMTADTLDHLFQNKVSARKFLQASKQYQ
ncbi:general substrate transporter [Dactylonectria macrodidyma]|uniref:General substrate transporter n=1 Tax=Dactylonectria macrodidyma TaxID=307937 RepID=A0A9P9IQT7_9HYPO|nr:general substrate transporter [Dactylonectria macrodidyma]